MTTAERYNQYVLPTYGRFPNEFISGQGAWLEDSDGTRYLDFCTGIAVCSLGHSHPVIQQALKAASTSIQHVSNLYHIEDQGKLAELIVEAFVGHPGRIFFSNSGAEANDGLIKAARRYGHLHPQPNGQARYEVLTFTQSFHGRTLGSMAATGQEKIKQGFDPMLPGFRHLPFNDIEAVKQAIAPETVAILLEPIQGEGGINVASKEFLIDLETLCRQRDILLFFDEVQSGFGRTGDPCAWTSIAPEVIPDGLSWAKGMGGGVPIGCFWLSDRKTKQSNNQAAAASRISDVLGAGSHGSTYGGNPLCSKVAFAVLNEIAGQQLWLNARRQSQRIKANLNHLSLAPIKQVRGLGLMLGIELNTQFFPSQEASTPALTLVKALMDNRLLTVPAGPAVVRWLPPLNVTDSEVDRACQILATTLEEFARQ